MSGEVLPTAPIPDDMSNLHWVVSRWVKEHKADQARRAQEIKNFHPDDLWVDDPIPDLTERDLYRFRVTSALLKGLERTGAKIVDGNVSGKLEATIEGYKLEFTVAEKMVQHRRPSIQDATWTAFSRLQYSHRSPSGYLRFTINTYVGKSPNPQWVESTKKMAPEVLPKFIAALNAAPAWLRQSEKERQEWNRRYELERQREEEERRAAQLETERWEGFKQLSNNWEEVRRLRRFLGELQSRPDEFAYEIEGMTISEYLAWAQQKIDELDPFVLRDQQKENEI